MQEEKMVTITIWKTLLQKLSLQVAAKNYIMAGGELSGGKGLLDTKDIIG